MPTRQPSPGLLGKNLESRRRHFARRAVEPLFNAARLGLSPPKPAGAAAVTLRGTAGGAWRGEPLARIGGETEAEQHGFCDQHAQAFGERAVGNDSEDTNHKCRADDQCDKYESRLAQAGSEEADRYEQRAAERERAKTCAHVGDRERRAERHVGSGRRVHGIPDEFAADQSEYGEREHQHDTADPWHDSIRHCHCSCRRVVASGAAECRVPCESASCRRETSCQANSPMLTMTAGTKKTRIIQVTPLAAPIRCSSTPPRMLRKVSVAVSTTSSQHSTTPANAR